VKFRFTGYKDGEKKGHRMVALISGLHRIIIYTKSQVGYPAAIESLTSAINLSIHKKATGFACCFFQCLYFGRLKSINLS